MKPSFEPPRELVELQNWLKWVIVDPRGVQRALAGSVPSELKAGARLDRDIEPEPRALNRVAGADFVERTRRLSVYAEAYFARLLEVLQDQFAISCKVLGDERFSRLIADYLKAYPSNTFNVSDVGVHLPEFAKEWAPEEGFLVNLTQMERHLLEVFFEWNEDTTRNWATQISHEVLATSAFRFSTALRSLKSEWPMDQIWEQAKANALSGEFSSREKSHFVVSFDSEGERVTALTPLESQLFEALKKGCTLEEFFEETPLEEEDATLIFSAFQKFIGYTWIVGLKI